MTDSMRQVYCGPPGIRLSQLAGPPPEQDLSLFFKGLTAFTVHKGRTAIRLACDLLGMGPDAEILAPSYNCGSEIDALLSSGSTVSLYRITRSAAIDIADLDKRITRRTRGMYVTHYFGFPHDLTEVKALCRKNGLFLIEDCALSLFSLQGGRTIGTAGDISLFSLPKTLPVPDGGILLVNHEGLSGAMPGLRRPAIPGILAGALPGLKAAFLRWLSGRGCSWTGGFSRKVPQRANGRPGIPAEYYYNEDWTGKGISPLSARLSRMSDPDAIRDARRRNFTMLSSAVDCPGVEPLFRDLPEGVCPLVLPVIVDNRDELAARLKNRSIDARAWWRGYHRELPWDEFPDACSLKNGVLALPVHQDLSAEDIAYIAYSFRKLVHAS